jgi:hypothetical protein
MIDLFSHKPLFSLSFQVDAADWQYSAHPVNNVIVSAGRCMASMR